MEVSTNARLVVALLFVFIVLLEKRVKSDNIGILVDCVRKYVSSQDAAYVSVVLVGRPVETQDECTRVHLRFGRAG